jgi:hypothetical protein
MPDALTLLARHNLQVGDPPVHFFLADATGRAAIVEYVEGEIRVTWNEDPWLAVTNFIVAGTSPEIRPSLCSRYRTALAALTASRGRMDVPDVLALLSAVSQSSTMWSVAYEVTDGRLTVAPGRDFRQPLAFGVTASRD